MEQSEIEKIINFISFQKLLEVVKKFEEEEKRVSVHDLGFNIFPIISDQYQKENLHSDIIRTFLNPKAKHNEKNKFLLLFIKFLNQHNHLIDESDYKNADVEREEGRVDILIKGNGHCIIVENKMNNATDQDRQLPTYLEKCKSLKYEVDAIIYLNLSTIKEPDKKNWTPDEIKEISNKLILIAAYKNSSEDLYNGWILPCEGAIEINNDAKFLFSQYRKLIKYLGGPIMTTESLKEIYTILKEKGKIEDAILVKNAIDNLPTYFISKIVEECENIQSPFNRPYTTNGISVFDQWNFGDSKYCLTATFIPASSKYQLRFFDKNKRWDCNENLKLLLNKEGFTEWEEEYTIDFKFLIEDDKLLEFLKALLTKLVEIKCSGKT